MIPLETQIENSTYLEHHGIKNQKWGVRRYQNPDGSLTEEGKKRYGIGNSTNRGGKKQSSYEKKIAKLEAKEQKMTEREEITRRKNQLKERAKNLKTQGVSDRKIQKERDRRSVSDLTDDELSAVINRRKLEKEYIAATKGPEKKSGAKIVSDILIKSGKDALGEASKTIMVSYIKKAFGVENSKKDKKNNSGGNDKNDGNSRNDNNRNSNTRRNADTRNPQDWNDFAGDVEEFWRRRNRR